MEQITLKVRDKQWYAEFDGGPRKPYEIKLFGTRTIATPGERAELLEVVGRTYPGSVVIMEIPEVAA